MKSIVAATMAALFIAGPASAQANLTAETSDTGSASYLAMAALGEVAAGKGLANLQILDSQTLTNSLQNVAEGKTDIAGVPFILPFLMSRGAGPYANLGPEAGKELADNVAVLFTYRFGAVSLYSLDSSPVSGWDDIADRSILNGPPRGAALTVSRAIIKIVSGLDDGEGYNGVQVNWGSAAKTITDGTVEAAVIPLYFPDSRTIEVSASGALTIYSIPKAIYEADAMQKFLNGPGIGSVEFDLDGFKAPERITISSEDGVWRSPAVVGGHVVNKSMDFELAKSLTAAFLENVKAFEAKAPYMANVALAAVAPAVTDMCGPNPLKYHPGALEAWEEAGYQIPDCAKS